ncbi:hypothetical protein [Blastomonas aquatica]|uniref:Uncharacterized protein n=1 Tax=Blastomonas aquatica TaxID=1510276 RepID=A0ABQ1IZ96_9SPHN|nr:hypothetical protein [Blastomonas aquatica]GGB55803.1 hypothetical protein GCM10010833_08130 [Blastomonas aquatica]
MAAPHDSGQADVLEIEITPAMVDAASDALMAWSGEFDFDRLPASEIAVLAKSVVLAALKIDRTT